MQEYPKYLPDFDVVAQTEDEEQALGDGRAVVDVVKAAQGDIRTVRMLPEPPAPVFPVAPTEGD